MIPDDEDDLYGKNFLLYRLALKLTQRQLAERLEVSRSFVQSIEAYPDKRVDRRTAYAVRYLYVFFGPS
jgi:transcriptional regulator with XRE-family HTH domain